MLRSEGQFVAGVYGVVFGRTCEFQHLYVVPEGRKNGIGRLIMDAAEQEAIRRGCTQVVLFSHASQGELFYPKLGYTLLARVEDYPDGDAALWCSKCLRPCLNSD